MSVFAYLYPPAAHGWGTTEPDGQWYPTGHMAPSPVLAPLGVAESTPEDENISR